MKTIIRVNDIICIGCNNSTLRAISELPGVFGASFDIENRTIAVEHTDEVTREQIVVKLREAGFREII